MWSQSMMAGVLGVLIAGAVLTTSEAASAQDISATPDQSTIVVTGERNTEQRVRDFVGAITWVPARSQLGRFEQSVCPVAVGLSQLQAVAVANRMRRVAESVGIRVDGANCVPNVVVVVTSDKSAFMAELRKKYPHYFGPMPHRQIRELVRQPGPATAWQLKGPPVSARGTELHFDPSIGQYVNRTTEAASRINTAARPQFDAAVVVVERSALAGLTTTQLADYASMRAFTGSEPSRLGNSGAPTILRILEAPMGSEVPVTLTHWDLGFLRGFYASPRNLNTAAQRSAIRQSVVTEIEPKPAE